MLSAVIAIAPVLLLLLTLVVMDSFKLVRPRAVAAALLWGALAAATAAQQASAYDGDESYARSLGWAGVA